MIPIYVTSPIQKLKVKIGEVDVGNKTATFWINQVRLFQEAKAIGPDCRGYDRKAIRFCNWIELIFEGHTYRIRRHLFEQNMWRYPKTENPDYKANSSNFSPKYFITLGKLAGLEQTKEKKDLETVKASQL